MTVIQSLIQGLNNPTEIKTPLYPKGSPQTVATLMGKVTADDAAELCQQVDDMRQIDNIS